MDFYSNTCDFALNLKTWKTSDHNKVSMPGSESDYQLHIFCDASTAYRAFVFLRQRVRDFIGTKMFTAKTRLTPIKFVCVPRLELCEALIGAKLVEALSAAISDD